MSSQVSRDGSRAGPGSAAARWRAMVDAEHAQVESIQQRSMRTDYWSPFARQFRPDLARPDDPQLQRLSTLVTPDSTVLDVGAGGGRLSLPLARLCRHVTAVEPSEAMCDVLLEEAGRHRIANITLIRDPWAEAEAAPADLAVCSHVIYTVRDVEGFVRKLEAHARERVVLFLFMDPPQHQLFPFWQRVHGEERLRLPCLQELMSVLWGMGVLPDLEMLPARRSQGFPDRERARDLVRARLFVAPGTGEDRRLEQALDELLYQGQDGSLFVRGASAQRPGMVSWRPREDRV